ncbi:MAG: hypothetical protein A2X86_20075 [Bdellovibrionales bacterium GWA2_49_15]|nr:MAG: hypothetical protein A2X86_20075 [Bdellovibrionales bacterium GWA2_49_15]HAZ11390.1 hypothetical protein [Bdellovibrionales bacterium]
MEPLQRLNHAVDGIQKATLESLDHAKDQVLRTSRETAQMVDHTAHKSPWVFVGVASALSGIVGYVLGRRFR